MQAKPWYKSKTLWAHGLALILYLADRFGVAPFEYTNEQLFLINAVAGVILRFFTKQPVTPPAVKE